jgi:hypothetical protein
MQPVDARKLTGFPKSKKPRLSARFQTNVLDALQPILLYPRGPQPCQTVLVQRPLPRQVFLGRQRVTITGFLEAQEAPAYGCNHFGFAPDDPAVTTWWWQIRYCQRAPVGADDIVDAGTQLTVSVHTLVLTLTHTGRTTGA